MTELNCDVEAMGRKELQALAKNFGVKANQKSEILREKLREAIAASEDENKDAGNQDGTMECENDPNDGTQGISATGVEEAKEESRETEFESNEDNKNQDENGDDLFCETTDNGDLDSDEFKIKIEITEEGSSPSREDMEASTDTSHPLDGNDAEDEDENEGSEAEVNARDEKDVSEENVAVEVIKKNRSGDITNAGVHRTQEEGESPAQGTPILDTDNTLVDMQSTDDSNTDESIPINPQKEEIKESEKKEDMVMDDKSNPKEEEMTVGSTGNESKLDRIVFKTRGGNAGNKYSKSNNNQNCKTAKFSTKLPPMRTKEFLKTRKASESKPPIQDTTRVTTKKQEVPLWKLHSKDFMRKGRTEKTGFTQAKSSLPRQPIPRRPFQNLLNAKTEQRTVVTKPTKAKGDSANKLAPKSMSMSKRNEEQMKKFLERQSAGRQERAQKEKVRAYANYVRK